MGASRRGARAGVVLLLAILALGMALRATGLSGPWERGHRGQLGGFYFGVITRTYAQRGLADTRGAPAFSAGAVTPRPIPYLHHPPLLGVLLLPARRALGGTEFSLRVLPWLLSGAGILLLGLLGRDLLGRAGGLAAAAAFAILPAGVIYGHFVSYEPFVLGLCLAALALTVHHRAGGPAWSRVLAAVLFLLATLVDWPAWFFAPVLGIAAAGGHGDPRRRRRAFLAWQGLAVLAGALFVAFGAAASGGVLPFLRAFLDFSAEVGERGLDVTAAAWGRAQAGYLHDLYGPPALALAAIGTVLWLRDLRRPDRRADAAVALALLLPAVANVTVFWRNAADHDFHTYYFLPMVALGVGRVAAALTVRRGHPVLAAVPATALLVALGVLCIPPGQRNLRDAATTFYRDLGRAIAEHTTPDTLVLASSHVLPASFYADRGILPVPVRRVADLGPVAGEVLDFGLAWKRVVWAACRGRGAEPPLLDALAGVTPLVEEPRFALYELPPAWLEAALRRRAAQASGR